MFTKEILQTVKREQLREWARVNGADMQAYDQVEAAWEAANTEEVIAEITPTANTY